MSKVLVIEDDPNIIGLICIHLRDLNLEVETANNGIDGLKMALTNQFELIILDVMLPGMDGIQVSQKMRALNCRTPLLMLTAKSEEFDKVMGLESGADDYLTKPFGVRELVARVKALLRRVEFQTQSPTMELTHSLVFGALVIYKEKLKVLLNDQKVQLTPKEFDLLLLLAENPGISFSREQLLEKVWGYEFAGYEHTVNSHVNRLRAKIEPDINNPRYVLTTWGVGYRFNDELERS
jgi:two-component system, OmpR family, alkaline phosphatase synthesis response regulator PhoP